ncbi:tetratricopeptide repeat protein [Kordia sp.]|uniref:tetratricopeptide repeat protein n=1 Tax=Kordia sp. TaxID=1965332 RepID=UPI003B5A1544
MKQVLPFFYFLLLCCCSLFAQEEHFQIPDSLANKTYHELISYIKKYRYLKPEVAKVYANTYHAKAKTKQSKANIATSYFYLANIADTQGEFNQAVSLINKGISIADTKQHKTLRKLYNLRGKVHGQYGRYEKSISDFTKTLQISEEHNDESGVIIAKINIAVIQLKTKQYYESLKTFRKMLHISKDSTLVSKNSRVSIFIGLCDNFLKTKKLDSARFYLDKGMEESIRIGDYESVSYLYPFDALYYYHKNDIPKSLEILQKAKEEISKLQEQEQRNIEVYYYMAQCYIAMKDYKTAIEHIEKAYKLIHSGDASGEKQTLKDNFNKSKEQKIVTSEKSQFIPYEYLYLLETLVQCYEELGDTKNRDLYYEKYYPLKLESYQKDVRIHELIFDFHEAPRIALMEKLSKKEGAAEKKVKYLYYLLVLLTIGIMIGFIFYQKKERQKQIAYEALIEKVNILETQNSANVALKTSTKKTVSITDEKAQDILKGLLKFEQQEHYLDENCNLRFVAKKVKTNATYLSKIINTHKECSFNEYINDLRIQYTLKRLKSDSLFRAYSIKSIAQEVGYKSADSFTKHFKKQTSLYPSYYIKKLNKEEV